MGQELFSLFLFPSKTKHESPTCPTMMDPSFESVGRFCLFTLCGGHLSRIKIKFQSSLKSKGQCRTMILLMYTGKINYCPWKKFLPVTWFIFSKLSEQKINTSWLLHAILVLVTTKERKKQAHPNASWSCITSSTKITSDTQKLTNINY